MKNSTTTKTDGISKIDAKIRLTKWTASSPVTKRLGLTDDGNLQKLSTAAQLYEGAITPLALSPEEFVKQLVAVGENDCFSYAIPTESNVHHVLSRERFAAQGQPSGAMTRTADKLVWPSGPGILMLDYDPYGDAVLTKGELLNAIYSICPDLKQTAHIWAVSTSSCLYDANTDRQVRGIGGQRIYIAVANGADIPRAGLALFQRLWLAGFGHIKISVAGSLLVRSIVDNCVWQTNRIDYVAPPICMPPLVSRKPIDQTVMLTAMLTSVVRKLLPTAPGFGFDAPVQGSGKTLLLKVLCVLAGETPTISPQPDSMNDEEMRKRIFSMLREGKGALVIDNIVGMFDSPSLAAVVTSVSYSDRVLKESRTESVPSNALVIVSGNNLTLMGDLPRRFMICRIDPKVEVPHARSFKFDPEQLAMQYRQELVAAAVTLMRAYRVAELDKRIGAGRMASFEIWDDLVRQTVCWLAQLQLDGALPTGVLDDGSVFPVLTDPMAAVNEAVAHDPLRERHGVLLLEIAKKFGFGKDGKSGPMFTVKELVAASDPLRNAGLGSYNLADEEEAALFDALVEVGGDSVGRRINKRSLGKYLAKNKDRIVNGLRLRQGPSRQHYATYWVDHVDGELGELSEFVSDQSKQPVELAVPKPKLAAKEKVKVK